MRVLTWGLGVLVIGAILIAALSHWKQYRLRISHPPVGDFIEIDGNRLHYLKAGRGPGLILLHGAGGNLRDFTFSQFETLAQDYTVIAFDRPGYGYSDRFDNGGASLGHQADLLLRAAQKLGLQEATVLGYSYGGAVAVRMALDAPQFVHSLMLVAPVLHTWPDDSVGWEHPLLSIPIFGPAMMHIIYALRGDGYFRPLYEGVFRPQSSPEGYIDHVGLGLSVNPRVQVINARQIMALADEIRGQIPRYQELRQNIEILHGTQDASVSHIYHAKDFIADAPNADIATNFVQGYGHGIHQLGQKWIFEGLARLRAKHNLAK